MMSDGEAMLKSRVLPRNHCQLIGELLAIVRSALVKD